MPGPDILGDRQSGQDVRSQNVVACQAIANIVKSSLGPVGLDKCPPLSIHTISAPPVLAAQCQYTLSSSSSGEGSDSEFYFEDFIDEDLLSEAGSIPKLQFRKTVIKSCWNDELCMSEVLHHKGGQLISNGIVRNGKVYLSIEETLFLSEIGSLMLVDDKDGIFVLEDIYKKLAEGKGGCCLEYFKVYRYLKSLGYIVGRHGIPWSLKTVRSCSVPLEDNAVGKTGAPETFLSESLNNLQIIENKPFFDVYLPNCKFRKTSPGDPVFTVSLARHHPPSIHETEKLGRQCNGIPLKIAHVEHDRVSFFSFKHVELPTLP